jgi:hypothetical protein
MNDFELDRRLKRVPLPERSDDYWEYFPSQVRVRSQHSRPAAPSQSADGWQFAWAGCAALVLIFVCVEFHPFQTVSLAITKQDRHFHMQLARLDTGLHKLMLNTDGMGYLLTEAN